MCGWRVVTSIDLFNTSTFQNGGSDYVCSKVYGNKTLPTGAGADLQVQYLPSEQMKSFQVPENQEGPSELQMNTDQVQIIHYNVPIELD